MKSQAWNFPFPYDTPVYRATTLFIVLIPLFSVLRVYQLHLMTLYHSDSIVIAAHKRDQNFVDILLGGSYEINPWFLIQSTIWQDMSCGFKCPSSIGEQTQLIRTSLYWPSLQNCCGKGVHYISILLAYGGGGGGEGIYPILVTSLFLFCLLPLRIMSQLKPVKSTTFLSK